MNLDQPALEVVSGSAGKTPGDATPVFDCWNTIGVEGNGTCRELVRFVHCRNCPVFSAAGLQLLNRPLDAAYRSEQTAHYAARKKLTTPARLSVVIFRLEAECFALPTTVFQEIALDRPQHSLPHRARSVALGIVNVRGELLVCASLGRLLGVPETSPRSRSQQLERLLVAAWNNQRVAFPVDEVFGIHRFQQEELREAPSTVARSTLTYTRGVLVWRERAVGFLHAESLFAALNRSLS
jgi:chemotaxis-related protein WspD